MSLPNTVSGWLAAGVPMLRAAFTCVGPSTVVMPFRVVGPQTVNLDRKSDCPTFRPVAPNTHRPDCGAKFTGLGPTAAVSAGLQFQV